MRIGVPKEIKNNEFRVGLTPGSVREYASHGHKVFVEANAGAGINASDKDYRAAGATAIFPANPFERRLRDALTASQQVQGRIDHYATVGQYLLGMTPDANIFL